MFCNFSLVFPLQIHMYTCMYVSCSSDVRMIYFFILFINICTNITQNDRRSSGPLKANVGYIVRVSTANDCFSVFILRSLIKLNACYCDVKHVILWLWISCTRVSIWISVHGGILHLFLFKTSWNVDLSVESRGWKKENINAEKVDNYFKYVFKYCT